MKYIRTKEGKIVDTTTKYLNFVSKEEYLKQVEENREGLIISYIENNVWYCYCEEDGNVEWKTDILAQANTIEELCDELVAISKNNHKTHFVIHRYFGSFDIDEWLKNNIYEIYGAIWTDKGLIYVAKMNDKGELELL